MTPATFNIPAGDVAGLVAAINTANTNNQPDVINLAAGSVYTFTSRADNSLGGNALPEIALDGGVAKNSLTINGHGATVQRSSAMSTPYFRFMKIGPSNPSGTVGAVDVNINDLTMTAFNAPFPTDGFTPGGGAITVNRANVTLTNCVLTGDSAQVVGGIFVIGERSQVVTLNQCTVTNNLGGSGAVHVEGPNLIVNGGTISNNVGAGGIFFQIGNVCTVTGTVIQNNGSRGIDASG
ncbi:MAG TPA: right-handed parallel beta-helix repeat-containing protein, partial [Gemmataceae bacterium]|nr:right-handed parallel beta-helix repeat-containing protein [Gemmataceae bacterium]